MNFFKILLFLNFKFFFKLLQQINKYIIYVYYSIMMRVYACKQLQVQISPRFHTQTLWHKQFSDFLSVFSIGSMVSGQFNSKSEGGPVNQREGQIITEYLDVLVDSRIKCETSYTYKSWYFDWEGPHALNQQ